jgi:hypothetical protein
MHKHNAYKCWSYKNTIIISYWDDKSVPTCQECINLLNHRVVEIDTTPDLTKSKPLVILNQEEIGKLLRQFEIMRETWIALKYNDTIFIIWRELIFSTQKITANNAP